MPRSQISGHPAESLIPKLAAQGLGSKAIAKQLSARGPAVTPSAVENRLRIMASTARKVQQAVAAPLPAKRQIPNLNRAEAATLPAVEEFGKSIKLMEDRADLLLRHAENSVIDPETGRADPAQLNAASGLIKSTLALVRTRAELVGALGGPAVNQHHPQVVIVFGGGMAAVQAASEVREVGEGDVDWLDEE